MTTSSCKNPKPGTVLQEWLEWYERVRTQEMMMQKSIYSTKTLIAIFKKTKWQIEQVLEGIEAEIQFLKGETEENTFDEDALESKVLSVHNLKTGTIYNISSKETVEEFFARVHKSIIRENNEERLSNDPFSHKTND